MDFDIDTVYQICPVCEEKFLVKNYLQDLLLQCPNCRVYIKNGRQLTGEPYQPGMKLTCRSCGKTIEVVDAEHWDLVKYGRCRTMCAIADA